MNENEKRYEIAFINATVAWVHREDEEDHNDAPEPHNIEARVGEHARDDLAAVVSAPNICVPALHEHDYL